MNGLVVAGIVAAIFLVALLLWRRRSFHKAQHIELVQVRTRCASVKDQATIFVMIVTHDNAYAAARAIHSVFDSAACPFRVYVGLHETAAVYSDPAAMRNVAAQATPVMALYANLARTGRYGRSFAEQVRAVRVPLHQSYGMHTARATLMEQAYRGQTFVVTLTDAAELQRGWDTIAIDSLAKCRDPHALLVAPPAAASTVAAASSRHDAWDVAAASFLGQGQSRGARMPCFPTFSRFSKAGLPVLGARPFGRLPEQPVPALFWHGDCTFGPARAYVPHAIDGVDPSVPPLATPFDASLACLTSGEDGVMSARLWTNGWAFYAPTAVLAMYQDGTRVSATADADKHAIVQDAAKTATAKQTHEACRLLLGGGLRVGDAPRILYVMGLGPIRTLTEWQAYTGLDMTKRLGSGRAQMGATPDPDATEIVSKYDSYTSFRAERNAYK